MTEEQAIEILKEIQEGSRAWLRVAKEKSSEKIYLRNIEAIETVLNMLQEKDKIIDLMTEDFALKDRGYYKKENGGEILGIMRRYNKEEWKEYYENKAKENKK